MYSIEAIKPIPMEWQCRNNPWVKCQEKNKCGRCGWNPEVAEMRRKEQEKHTKG